MKLNWCLILHKWQYNEEKVIVGPIHNKRLTKITIHTRTCQRCYKKQKANIGYGSYNWTIGKDCTWKDIKLTKAEQRDIKLNKLGI